MARTVLDAAADDAGAVRPGRAHRARPGRRAARHPAGPRGRARSTRRDARRLRTGSAGSRSTDVLPATYPHVLAFPLQVALMTDRSFPLALPGLVHVRNRIEVCGRSAPGEPLDLEVWAERFAAHRSGATVDLCASVAAGGEEVWRGRSTYLARGAKAPDGRAGGRTSR